MMKKFLSLIVVAVMVFAIALPVCAEISPEIPAFRVDTEVIPSTGANVSYIYNEDGTVEIVVTPNDGFEFLRWEIEGDYEIVSGTLNDTSLVVRPNGDIKADAILDEKVTDTQKPDTQKPDTQKPDTQKPDTQKPGTQKPDSTTKPAPKPGTQSPSTGVIPVAFAAVMAVSVAGIGISFKKSSK